METIFDIYRGSEKIGKAEVCRQGLYYRFRCFCNLTGDVIYRLVASVGTSAVNLGIPVPEGDGFRLETKVAVNKFGNESFFIRAVPGNLNQQRIFAPVHPDEPFKYIKQLENARMERRDGLVGVVFDTNE